MKIANNKNNIIIDIDFKSMSIKNSNREALSFIFAFDGFIYYDFIDGGYDKAMLFDEVIKICNRESKKNNIWEVE